MALVTTPAFLSFLLKHGGAFRRWREEARLAPSESPSARVIQGDLFNDLQPAPPARPAPRRKKSDPAP